MGKAMAALAKKRDAFMVELDKTKKLNVDLFKATTGKDKFTCAEKYEKQMVLDKMFSVIAACNDPLRPESTYDLAFERRYAIAVMPNTYLKNPNLTTDGAFYKEAQLTNLETLATSPVGAIGLMFDMLDALESSTLWGKEEGSYARLRALGAGEGDSRFGAEIRSRGSEKRVER